MKETTTPNGWIKLHRDLLDSKLWSCSDATFRVAVYLLLSANHSTRWHRRIKIEKGQCVRSLSMISEACSLSRKAVRYAIETLKGDNFIEIDEPFGAQQGHRITVCKYDTYQTSEDVKGTEGSNEGNNAGNNEGNTNKKGKNEKNEKNQPVGVDLPFNSEAFNAAWKDWRDHRKAMKRAMTPRAEQLAINKLPGNEAEAIRWINHAIEKGWQGIYEPKGKKQPDDIHMESGEGCV